MALSQSEPLSNLRASRNGRHFIDCHGDPAFWLGDTQWELFRLHTPESAQSILRDRRDKGFNTILVMLTGIDHRRLDPHASASFANLDGELPWHDDNPLRPNDTYFRHIDTLLRLIAGSDLKDLCLVVGVYHQWHDELITRSNARAWARWVARRYRDVPNLIWSMYPRADASYVSICRELATGLQEGDGGSHLISVHPDPAVASSSFMHAEPWLAFNMIQTCTDYEMIPEAVLADYALEPAKPVVMAEGGYEGLEFGRLQTAHEIRKQAYWSQLSGGHVVYGHQEAWLAPEAWRTWLDAPGSRDMRTFRAILTSLPAWWTLAPAHGAITASESGTTYAPGPLAARSDEAGWTLIYLGDAGSVSLTTPPPAQAVWIDPRSGDRQPATPATGRTTFTTPPDWDDALLYIT